MTEKLCLNCKWFLSPKVSDEKNHICANPLNDFFYDHFNASTGNTVENIRRAMPVDYDDVCDRWEKRKAK